MDNQVRHILLRQQKSRIHRRPHQQSACKLYDTMVQLPDHPLNLLLRDCPQEQLRNDSRTPKVNKCITTKLFVYHAIDDIVNNNTFFLLFKIITSKWNNFIRTLFFKVRYFISIDYYLVCLDTCLYGYYKDVRTHTYIFTYIIDIYTYFVYLGVIYVHFIWILSLH